MRAEAIRQARAELDAVIAEIRRVPGFKAFLMPPTFDDVASAARQHPLVYIAAADPGGMALIVTGTEVEHVPLPELATEPVAGRVRAFLAAHDARGREPVGWVTALDDIAGWLWTAAMSPVLAAVAPADEIVIVAGGLLGLLPLHAAWTPDARTITGRRYALDDVTIRYAPNARALTAAEQLASETGKATALVVVEPQPVRAPELPWAEVEGFAAASAFGAGATVLPHAEATKDEFCDIAPHVDVLHLACHGRARLDAPLESGLLLAHNRWLKMRELLALRLHARLAVLSACETSRPGTELPDEVVSLPTGLLQAGVASVIATLWVVPDLEAALLMTRLYGAEGPRAVALRDAQQWMRDTSDEQKLAEIEARPDWLPEPVAEAFANGLREPATDTSGGLHPWAGFVYVGA